MQETLNILCGVKGGSHHVVETKWAGRHKAKGAPWLRLS